MSNYYHRDENGHWFIKNGSNMYPVEFSSSMEIAYAIGRLAVLKEIMDETYIVQNRDS